MNDRELLEQARKVCTPSQIKALELKAKGYGVKRIARILGISPQAASARLEGARRRLQPKGTE